MAQARTGAACGGMLCGITLLFRLRDQSDASSGAGTNIAFLVQYSKINSLMQVNGHAAAKPGGNAGRSPSCKGRRSSAGDKQAGEIPAKRNLAASEGHCGKTMTMKPSGCMYF
ncbi:MULTISPECIES: hypothetical protein [unclassified Escherichia]|uniref:hypothetical protein n=1 Tax=unclassified Escherichia TaxID=2608889 RepID=UPI0013EE6E69|nr:MULTISPECIES: hypothetical protein [unclassified Escherichia]